MWNISKLTTRLAGGHYKVLRKHGNFGYIFDDFGNLVPSNGVTYLIGH